MDINGNTLLHYAANNSTKIATLLKHIYLEEVGDVEDSNLAIEKSASPDSGRFSARDHIMFFDVNK